MIDLTLVRASVVKKKKITYTRNEIHLNTSLKIARVSFTTITTHYYALLCVRHLKHSFLNSSLR